jgi:hypothetical protein
VAGAHSALASTFGVTINREQKKAGWISAGNEGATQNGEDLNSRTLAAQTFPLRCTREHRHLNNYLCDRALSEKFQKKMFF